MSTAALIAVIAVAILGTGLWVKWSASAVVTAWRLGGKRPVVCSSSSLSPADDTQRMMLWCVFHDAYDWHYNSIDACPDCYVADICVAHWQEHGEPTEAYLDIMGRLERCSGQPLGVVCPLDASDLQTFSGALLKAIAYRTGRGDPESSALLAAYREFERYTAAAHTASPASP